MLDGSIGRQSLEDIFSEGRVSRRKVGQRERVKLASTLLAASYELANRPGWVAIPLNGILRVVEKVTGAKAPGYEHAASP